MTQIDAAPDAVLVRRSATDGEAFEGLYGRYVQRVYRWAVQRVGRDDAEDLVQQVFVQAYRAMPRFRGPSFAAWLFTIAQNVCRDFWRRQRVAGAVQEEPGGPDGHQTDGMRDVDTRLGLATALRALPPRQKTAIELRYFADLSLEDVASTMGISPGAAKALLHRGLCNLRDGLTTSGGA